MTVDVTGRTLDRAALVRVARDGEPVVLADDARDRMIRSRATVEKVLARGEPVYGSSTAVGVLKRVGVGANEAADYASRILKNTAVGQGPPAPADLVRGTMLRLAGHLAEGSPGVRPLLAETLVRSLNDGALPHIRTLGSIGQGDLAPMADLAVELFNDVPLQAGEGLALLANNAFSTAWAALAVTDAITLVDAMDVAGALSLEGLAANLTILHPAIGQVRPYPGLRDSLSRLGTLLEGSELWDAGRARSLQDPLTFRNLPQIQGACRDTLAHVEAHLAIELNASQGNPIVLADEDRVISVANFEMLPLAAALDHLRIVLASALSASAERSVKLLQTPWSGLPTGLVPVPDTAEPGLYYLGIAVQSLGAEARLLAQPVSFEMSSTVHDEGIEDRATMAPLAARRVADMIELGGRIVAIEFVVAAQAVDLRGLRLGTGTGRTLGSIRETVPFLALGDHVPDVEPLVPLIAAGRFR